MNKLKKFFLLSLLILLSATAIITVSDGISILRGLSAQPTQIRIGSLIVGHDPWVDVRVYASLNAAVAAIGATETTLVVPIAQTLAVDLTLPSTLTLKILQGGVITIAAGKTLTLNGPFEAGLYQVFNPLASWARYGSNLVTGWTNNGYETLTFSGANISSGINSAGDGVAYSNQIIGLTIGVKYRLNLTYTGTSGISPKVYFSANNDGTGMISLETTTESLNPVEEGFNEFVFAAGTTSGYLVLKNASTNVNFAMSGLSVVEYLNASTGGVVFGKIKEILPEWWGAYSNDDVMHAPDTTEAIRSAFVSAGRSSVAHAPGANYGPSYVGGDPTVKLQPGTYVINNEIEFSTSGYYSRVKGTKGATFIRQTDITKKIFYGHYCYRMAVDGITFVGGTNQLSLYNPGSDEGGVIDIRDCYHIRNDPTRWAIYILIGNTFAHVSNSMNRYTPKFLYVRCDQAVFKDSWLDGYAASGNKPNNTASVENHAFFKMENIVAVPEIPSTPISTNVRWIDNYVNISMVNVRFGSENSGIPIIWNFADASLVTSSVTNQSGIVIENSWLCSRQTAFFADAGVVVLKTAIPSVIRIVGGWFSTGGVMINDQIPGGVTAWLVAAKVANPYMKISIVIDQIPDWASGVITDANAQIALYPYIRYNKTHITGNYDTVYDLRVGDLGYGIAGKLRIGLLPIYTDNAAALLGGLVVGDFYRNNADPAVVYIVK